MSVCAPDTGSNHARLLAICSGWLASLVLAAWLPVLPVSAAPQDPSQPDESINEQTIYIPYEKLREVFEREGRGVFLPYDKFQQLWNEARKHQPQPEDRSPPLGAIITDIESVATLGNEMVSVDAVLKIELLRKGWQRIPLRLADAAIRSAKIGGTEARLLPEDSGGYALLVEHQNDQPQTLELNLSYAKALQKTRGQSSVAFQSPQAPVNRWTIRTGQKDVEVAIEPMIAASKPGEGEAENTDSANGELLAFVGAAPEVRIRWTPKSEGASGLAALISAESQLRVFIDEGVTRTSASLTFDISRAEVQTLAFNLPAAYKVVTVFDRNVKRWEVQPGDKQQTVVVELFEPTIGKQNLAVELELFSEQTETLQVEIPQIEAQNASRNQGIVLIQLAAGLRGEIEKKAGLLQLDRSEVPAEFAAQEWRFAYRYASLPIELAVRVEKIRPLINVRQLVEVELKPDEMNLEMSLLYDIQQAGVFQLLLDIPDTLELRDVRPLAQENVAGAAVDSFYRDPAVPNRWIVTLSSRAIGRVGLAVSAKRSLNDPLLLTPSEQSAVIPLVVPRAAPDGIEFATGNLVVYSPESLQINASELTSIRSESLENSLAGFNSRISQSEGLRPVLSFAFSAGAASLQINAKRRRPQVMVDQLLAVTVQNGLVRYQAVFFYNIRYSRVKSLRLDVPTALVDQLRNRSPNIIYRALDPQPADVPADYTAWELTGDQEFFGGQQIQFTWDAKMSDLELGKSATFNVPRLIPANVDRGGGQIVTTKSETIDIQPASESTGLRPIDPKTDLVGGSKIENAALAFEFVDDWSLDLVATRFQLEELKRTSIPKALIRVVALRQNQLSVQALYQIRSVDQRLAIRMPPGFDATRSFDDQPVTVNGRRVTPERGGDDLIYVPLTDQESGQAFLLDLRYTLPGTAAQIDLPSFPQDPAIQKVVLCVYLPFESALVSKHGFWTDCSVEGGVEQAGMGLPLGSDSILKRMFHLRDENVASYLNWVHAGVNADPSTSQKFQTDGRPYVFSTIQSLPPPDGSLQLRTMHRALLHVLVCVAIVAWGLAFIRRRFIQQMAALAVLLAGVTAIGIFFPLITEHLIGEVMLICIGGVIVVWLISDSARWLRQISNQRRAARAAAAESPEPASPDAQATLVASHSTSAETPRPPESPDA